MGLVWSATVWPRRLPVTRHAGRISAPPLRSDVLGDQHERRILLALEDLLCPLSQHDRRERPKCLPVFDPLVQNILHLGLARVRKQAAVAERARSELGAALKPADHALVSEQFCGLAADVVATRYRGLITNEEFRQGAVNVPIAVAPADIGVIHDE